MMKQCDDLLNRSTIFQIFSVPSVRTLCRNRSL